MGIQRGLSSNKLDILAITRGYLNGDITFEEYNTLEDQWYARFERLKMSRSEDSQKTKVKTKTNGSNGSSN